jgi:superfamily II DNA/RNA helicase
MRLPPRRFFESTRASPSRWKKTPSSATSGLNLQTLGTLINVDLPWNPSRLEQRIGRIKRFGQRRDRVDMLNLLYHGSAQPTVDEKVYAKLSSRMKDRFDIFGTLPDVIDDDWIDDEERLEAELKNYTNRRNRANRVRSAVRRRRRPERRTMGALRKGPGAERRQEKAVAGLGRAGTSRCLGWSDR